jgi:hypothetical protein
MFSYLICAYIVLKFNKNKFIKRVFFIRVRNVGLAKDNQRSLLTKSYITTCCRVSFRCRELDTFHTWSTHLLLVLRDSGLHVVHDSANNQVCGYCQVMYLSFALRLLTTLVSFDHWNHLQDLLFVNLICSRI